MAIAFLNATTALASTALAGQAVQNAWRDALLAHVSGAWTLVEEFDSAGATVHHVVIKNATALSLVGGDFYIVISRLVSSGQLTVIIGEGYDAPTKVLSNFAMASDVGGYAMDADGTVTATYALGAALPTGAAGTPDRYVTTPPASGRYIASIEKEFCVLGTTESPASYFGGFISLVTGTPDPVPLLGGNLNLGANSVLGNPAGPAVTRHLHSLGATSAIRYAQKVVGFSPLGNPKAVCRNYIEMITGTFSGGDRNQSNKAFASELLVLMSVPFTTYGPLSDVAGVLRGRLRAAKMSVVNNAMVFGDQLVIDGRKHMLLVKGNVGVEYAANGIGPQHNLALVVDTGVAA